MTYEDQTPDAIGRLRAELRLTQQRLAALERRTFAVPILNADPPAEDPTNLWILNDGRMRYRTADGVLHEVPDIASLRPPLPTFAAEPAISTGWRMWVRGSDGALRYRMANDTVRTLVPGTTGSSGDGGSGAPGGSTSSVSKPTTTARKIHRATWSATDAACYCPRHGREDELYYGRWDSTHGRRRVMYALPDAAIRSAINATMIRKVEVRVRNLHAYSNSGIDVRWGTHNRSSLGSSYSQRHSNAFEQHWPKSGYGGGSGGWRTIPTWIGRALRDNEIKGLTITQPSDSRSLYGLMHPGLQIRITYVS